METFIAAKEHDEDEENEEFKKLKAKDTAGAIRERKSNYVILNFNVKALKATSVKVSHPIPFFLSFL
jgi:hypothetical protein